MAFEIRDGTGSTSTAKVTGKNQLAVAADTMPREGRAAFDGYLHAFTTGPITLTTTGSYSGLLYITNSDSRPIYIWQIVAFGTVAVRWQFVKNPTTGTLISGGTSISATNVNFASTLTLGATLKKGGDGSTVTNGTTFLYAGNPAFDASSPLTRTPIIIGQSGSFALMCRPSASCDAFVSAVVSQEDLDL